MVGIRDVAKHSGVSTATVVRVLDASGLVGPELTERVLASVEELGYVRNSLARSLSRGKSLLIGLIIPDVANPFFSEVARGLEATVAQQGYHVLVASSNLSEGREAELLGAFAGRTVDAVVMMPMDQRKGGIERLLRQNIPVVFVGGTIRGLDVPSVVANGKAAAREAVGYLAERGHRKIGLVAGPTGFRTVSQGIAGFKQAHEDHSLPSYRTYLKQGYVGMDGGLRALDELLDGPDPPTACIALNHLLTVGALNSLRGHGVAVPDDMSIITFDDMPTYPLINPPLTAIAQPAFQMGTTAANLVLRSLAGEVKIPRRTVLKSTFIERESCRPRVRRSKR